MMIIEWNKKKTNLLAILLLILLFVLSVGFLKYCSSSLGMNDIRINEVCSNNFSAAKSPDGEYPDYVELYNPLSEEHSLDGYFLSDNNDNLKRLSLTGYTIEAEGYLVIWLDGRGNEATESDKENLKEEGTSGFGISATGESIFLTKGEEENVVDYVYVPELEYNTSYSRTTDGEGSWEIMGSTMGISNHTAEVLFEKTLEKPKFSVESGFYEEAFSLKLSTGLGNKIYYTLDGNEPSTDSLEYTGEIEIKDITGQENLYAARTDLSPTRDYAPDFPVDKAVVVRAISYDPLTNNSSEAATEVFFVGYENKTRYDDFPIISIVTDSVNLFDHETGIYTNGISFENYKKDGGVEEGQLLGSFVDENGDKHLLYEATNAFMEGKEWEREAVMTFFDNTHEYIFTQNVGIRIAGASTRGTPQKSFNIYGRDIYDEQVVFPYEFFDGSTGTTIKLRNGGNHNSTTKFRDAFVESLIEDRDVAIQRSTPCILFLNGEYWGIYNIRERYTEEYIKTHYGVEEDNVWIIDAGRAKAGGEAAQEAYEYFVTMATECDLTYDDVYAMVSELIDVQSFIDYCCVNIFLDNTDLSFGQNMALWRSAENDGSEYGDTKWRWMVFDMDEAIQAYDENTDPGEWMKNYCLMQEPVLQSFMRNQQFREQFYNTFVEIASNNFNYEDVHQELMQWKDVYEEQLLLNHMRFFNEGYDKESFEADIAFMDDFFAQRYDFTMQALEETFLDTDREQLE